MLPSQPPPLSDIDFDPDATDNEDEDDPQEPTIQMSSIEVNMAVYHYLLEANYKHAAYSFLKESGLEETEMYKHFMPKRPSKGNRRSGKDSPAVSTFGDQHGRLAPGELVKKLWTSIKWEEVERHIAPDGTPYKEPCPNPFYLLRPHRCPSSIPSAIANPSKPFPTLRMSPPTSLPDLQSDSEDTPAAGPSTRKLEPPTKRKSRRNSDESTAITRSPSPASRKKRQFTNDEDDFVEKVKSVAGRRRKTEDGKNLVIPASSTPVRSTSPTKQDQNDILSSAMRLGQGNPKWFKSSEIGLFTEHRDIVNAVAWSPANHDLLASAGNDTSARIWDFTNSSRPNSTKLELTSTEPNPSHLHHKTIESSKNPVTCISWNAAGTLLATGAREGTARTFSASGFSQHVLTQGTNLAITAIKFSPNGRYLMSGSKGYITRILDVSGGQEKLLGDWKTHSDEVNDVDWLDDQVFATAGNDHKIFIHRLDDPNYHYVFEGHTDDVQVIKWSPLPSTTTTSSATTEDHSKRYLASIADDGQLIIWQIPEYPSSRPRNTSKNSSMGGTASPLKRESDEGEGDNYQFESSSRYLIHRFTVVEESENTRMGAVDWSRDEIEGRVLIAAGGQDSSIKIFDLTSKTILHTLEGFEDGTGCLSFSPRGFRGTHGAIAGGAWNASFKIWDVETGEILKEFEMVEEERQRNRRDRPFVTSIAWKPDGQHIAIGLYNKSIMTFYVGDLKRPVNVKGEDWKMD